MPYKDKNKQREYSKRSYLKYYLKNKEIILKKAKTYYQKNRIRMLEKHRAYKKTDKSKLGRIIYRKNNIEKIRLYNLNHRKIDGGINSLKHLLKKYLFSIDDYNNLFNKQNGVCAICFNPETTQHQNGKITRLALDHCHKTGIIRGFLCRKCNLGLGYFKNDVNFLKNAIDYLNKNSTDIKPVL